MRLLEHLFSSSASPTALFIESSYCYLTVVSALAQRGFRIPRDISLILRDHDQFLTHLYPEPTRYVEDLHTIIQKIMLLLRPMLEGAAVKADPVRVFPRFVNGGSCQAVEKLDGV